MDELVELGNVELHPMNRRAGKTTLLVNLMKEDNGKKALVAPTYHMSQLVLRHFMSYIKVLTRPEQVMAFDVCDQCTIYVEEWYAIRKEIREALARVSMKDNVKVIAVGTHPVVERRMMDERISEYTTK